MYDPNKDELIKKRLEQIKDDNSPSDLAYELLLKNFATLSNFTNKNKEES